MEPLLDPIAKNDKTVTVPFNDNIDPDTFAYIRKSALDNLFVGGFTWNLYFKWVAYRPAVTQPSQEHVRPVRYVSLTIHLDLIILNFAREQLSAFRGREVDFI